MHRATRIRPIPLLLLLSSLLLAACNHDIARETGAHPDGSPAFEREYLVTEDARKIPHGVHASWHPQGTRQTLEFFERGLRQGYAFRWNAHGDLVGLEMCDEGYCRERPLPGKAARAGSVLAATRFR